MTALSTLVPALQRELAVPGTFADVYPNTGKKDLVGSLADAFAQCRLDGFFKDVALDITTPLEQPDYDQWVTTPDLSDAGGALIVIYAAMRTLRATLRTMTTSSTYKAGSVEASQSTSATVLRAEMDYLVQRQKDLIEAGTRGARTCSAVQVDGYLARLHYGQPSYYSVGGFFPYEYLG
jgi:hypothetical protein